MRCQPEFCSVTFGAGGSTQEGTFGTVGEILAEGMAAARTFRASEPPTRGVRQPGHTAKPWA
jgi:methylenetetrahydrofolate reductase (NADPH)